MKEYQIPDTGKKINYEQEALLQIAEAESLGIDCTALKRSVIGLEVAGFNPEQHVLFERDE